MVLSIFFRRLETRWHSRRVDYRSLTWSAATAERRWTTTTEAAVSAAVKTDAVRSGTTVSTTKWHRPTDGRPRGGRQPRRWWPMSSARPRPPRAGITAVMTCWSLRPEATTPRPGHRSRCHLTCCSTPRPTACATRPTKCWSSSQSRVSSTLRSYCL